MTTTDGLRTSHVISPDDHGAYVTIAAALMLVWMALFYAFRLSIRLTFNGPLGCDDGAVSIGSFFGLAQSVTVFVAVNSGLGKHLSALSTAQAGTVGKSTYAAQMLFICALAFGKIATSQLVARLTRTKSHLVAAHTASAVTVVWGIASVIVIGIKCNPAAAAWQRAPQCSSHTSVWIAIGVLDIFTEAMLLLLPFNLVWGLQMPLYSKTIVVLAFMFRAPVIVLAVLRLINLNSALPEADYTFTVVTAAVYTQVEMHYSLIAATVPCMRPFLMAFNSGYLGTSASQVDPSASLNSKGRSESYVLQSKSSHRGNEPETVISRPAPRLRNDADNSIVYVETQDPTKTADRVSIESADGSDRMIIKKTVGYAVQYSRESHSQSSRDDGRISPCL